MVSIPVIQVLAQHLLYPAHPSWSSPSSSLRILHFLFYLHGIATTSGCFASCWVKYVACYARHQVRGRSDRRYTCHGECEIALQFIFATMAFKFTSGDVNYDVNDPYFSSSCVGRTFLLPNTILQTSGCTIFLITGQ